MFSDNYITIKYKIHLINEKKNEDIMGFENFIKKRNITDIKIIEQDDEETRFSGTMCNKNIEATYVIDKGVISDDSEYLKSFF